jgi:hypothetical protein
MSLTCICPFEGPAVEVGAVAEPAEFVVEPEEADEEEVLGPDLRSFEGGGWRMLNSGAWRESWVVGRARLPPGEVGIRAAGAPGI